MHAQLTIAVAQPESVPYDVAANAERHAETVRSLHADVVVFPELSLTGYHLDALPIGSGDPRLSPIIDACADTNSVAIVGAPVAGDTRHLHISMLVVNRRRATVAYHKMWLGTDEAKRFTPGREPAVITVNGWRLGLAICRDTGVPQHHSATAALKIDIYAAGVLENAQQSDVIVERARRVATEHRVWVAAASFAGSTGESYSHAAGHSGIWSPDGVAVAQAGPEVGGAASATLT